MAALELSWAAIYIPWSLTALLGMGGWSVSHGITKRIDTAHQNLKDFVEQSNIQLKKHSDQISNLERDFAVLQESFQNTSGTTGSLRRTVHDKMNDFQRGLELLESRSVTKDDIFSILEKVRDNTHKIESNYLEMNFHISKILENYDVLRGDYGGTKQSVQSIEEELKTMASRLDIDHASFTYQLETILAQMENLKKS